MRRLPLPLPGLAAAAVLALAAAGCGEAALKLHRVDPVRLSGDTFTYDCDGGAHIAPARLRLECRSGISLVATSLRWRRWGSPEPVATGFIARRACPRCRPQPGPGLPVRLDLRQVALHPDGRLAYRIVEVVADRPVLGRGPSKLVYHVWDAQMLDPLYLW